MVRQEHDHSTAYADERAVQIEAIDAVEAEQLGDETTDNGSDRDQLLRVTPR